MIYPFNTSEHLSVSQVGGKSKSLMEMTKAGLLVPKGLALSVKFFEDWDKEVRQHALWQSILSEPTKDHCDELKDLASKMTLTPQQREKLMKALEIFPKKSTLAVRSSSPEEDLAGSSFAGMYETYLGVLPDQLEDFIAKAYSSMYDFRVMEYKKQHNLDIEKTRISLIIQRQVPSDVSGVGFSLNPHNNCYDEAMINASFGLGEAIVSGIVTPDTYVVDKTNHKILEKKVNAKKIGLWLEGTGGIKELPNAMPKKQALRDDQIIELTDLITKCEEYYQFPVDIEWAYEGSTLCLLQARPITTYFPLREDLITKPGEIKHLYMDMIASSQGFSSHFSVLGLDIWNELIVAMKGGIIPVGPGGMVTGDHGRQYMDLSNSVKALGYKKASALFSMVGGQLTRTLSQLDWDEYTPKEKSEALKGLAGKAMKFSLKIIPSALSGLMKDSEKVVNNYLANTTKAKEGIRKDLPLDEPMRITMDNMIKEYEAVMSDMGIMMAGLVSEKKLKTIFQGTDCEQDVMTLGMDLPGNPTSAMGHALYNIAYFDEIKKTNSSEEFEEKYTKGFIPKGFLGLLMNISITMAVVDLRKLILPHLGFLRISLLSSTKLLILILSITRSKMLKNVERKHIADCLPQQQELVRPRPLKNMPESIPTPLASVRTQNIFTLLVLAP